MDELQSNEYYYNLRAHFSFHELILKDYEAMTQLQQVVSFNPQQIRDKVVLDIGSGPGVFSILAARAGAKKVYAWEPSIQAQYSEENIKANNFSDVIQVLSGPIDSLEIEPVDVLFTTNIGHGIYLNSLLQEFAYAKEHYLKEGGTILPSELRVSIGTFSPSVLFSNISYWKDVYGFDYTPIEEDQKKLPFLGSMASSRVKTDSYQIYEAPFGSGEHKGIFDREFELHVQSVGQICGFLLWFAMGFTLPSRSIVISTAPEDFDTHWSQVCVPFGEWLDMKIGDTIKGRISMRPAANMKSIAYCVDYTINDGEMRQIRSIFK